VEKGKRRGLIDMDDILAWLARKAQVCGFEILSVGFERVYWYESRGGKHDKALGGVQFDGILVVSDPDKLREAVRQGIGTQKAYGFGLLSLAPLEVRL
jgi:CRISPR system Cascade subunit CasE